MNVFDVKCVNLLIAFDNSAGHLESPVLLDTKISRHFNSFGFKSGEYLEGRIKYVVESTFICVFGLRCLIKPSDRSDL